MIDADDVSNGFVFGGVAVGLIFLLFYLVFSVPEIDECHKKGGQIVRIEGDDKCISTDSLKEVK